MIGDALRPTAEARTVRMRNGEVLVTDGPFAETREWIAGFDILECADIDEAIAVAAEHPMARFGRLELRAVRRRPGRRRRALTERADDAARRAVADAIAGERLRIVAALIRTTGDWDLAEDALADASERALERWSRDGIPDNPAAWLTTTARRRAIDVLRRRGTERAKLAELTVADDVTGENAASSGRSTTIGCASSSRAAIRRCRCRRASR